VTAETPMISRYDVTAGGSVSTDEINLVPAESRNIQATVAFLPGVSVNAQSQSYYGHQPQVEGEWGGRTAYYVDGVDTTFARLSGATRLFVPSFTMEQVKLESTGADAQYSRVVGGVVNQSLRSGTNQFHGGVTWYARNLDWDENYELTPVAMPDDRKDSWELSLGGPVVRDRLWFYLAYGDRADPGSQLLADGETFFDNGMQYEVALVKLDWRPSERHKLNATYIDNPNLVATGCPTCADIYTVYRGAWGADMANLGWDWMISDNLLLETHIALQGTIADRMTVADSPTDGPDPWRPDGNAYAYQDQLTRLYWNGIALRLGLGNVSFPRDQANVSVNWFMGNHDIKAGIDYQKVGWQSDQTANPRVIGRGYNPAAPGGFTQPRYFREYLGPQNTGEPSQNDSEMFSLFVRDRFTTSRWTFNLGLRADKQQHWTDVGVVTVDTTDLAPRLAAVYDVKGDSRLLVSATDNRFVIQVPQNWTQQWNETPSGLNYYDQYNWNPATQAYDMYDPARSPRPPEAGDIPLVDPWTKDEFTVGLDWAFHKLWAFKTKLVYWQQEGFTDSSNQLDENLAVVQVIGNNQLSESERKAIHLTLQRRFRNNWSIAVNYTYSETEGNCSMSEQARGCDLGFGNYLDVPDPETGVPASVVNRWGPLSTDDTHVFKIRGLYRLPVGKGHALSVGGSALFNSGEPWQLIENVDVVVDGVPVAQTTMFLEPRGSRRTPTYKQLNLNLEWGFPISGSMAGAIRGQINNVTNEQEWIGVVGSTLQTGEPANTSIVYQRPRYITILASFTF